jgi:hypothetical protein
MMGGLGAVGRPGARPAPVPMQGTPNVNIVPYELQAEDPLERARRYAVTRGGLFAAEGPETTLRPRGGALPPPGGRELRNVLDDVLAAGMPAAPQITPRVSGSRLAAGAAERVGAQRAAEDVAARIAEAARIAGMPSEMDIFAAEGPEAVPAPEVTRMLAALTSSQRPSGRAGGVGMPQAGGGFAPPSAREEEPPEAAPEAPTFDPQTAFMDAIEAAMEAAGKDLPEVRDIDAYKKEFAEATGIDISGKPDKSAALMAFGLALMQNRAGSGFNVGNILRSIGEAGEKALPALEAAKKETRANALAAGEYALKMRAADTAKREEMRKAAMDRSSYYIVPKSDGVSGFLANVDKGSLQALNAIELSRLQENKDFTSKYDILPGSTWSSIVNEAMKAPEAKEFYLTAGRDVPLFEGAEDDILKVRVFDPNPNTNPNGRAIISGDGQQQYEALARMARDNQKARERFAELGVLVEGQNIFRYSVDAVDSLASAFGIQFGEGLTETDRIKMILEKLQAKNAPEILGEAGKTISDGDRERVARIVGTITATTDPRVLAQKVEELFNDIVLGAEADIKQALNNLNRYTGRNIGDFLESGDMSEEDQAELAEGLRALGME